MILDTSKYPIGKFVRPEVITPEILEAYILDISTFPNRIRKETAHLNDEQLDTPYRTGGWTLRQVVHHCADSHMQSLTRFKLALTEDKPTIKPYYEDRWAELPDSKMSIAPALQMLDGIHERWFYLLKNLTQEQLKRTFTHPEHNKEFPLNETIAMYAWHCRHHLAHVTSLKARVGWD